VRGVELEDPLVVPRGARLVPSGVERELRQPRVQRQGPGCVGVRRQLVGHGVDGRIHPVFVVVAFGQCAPDVGARGIERDDLLQVVDLGRFVSQSIATQAGQAFVALHPLLRSAVFEELLQVLLQRVPVSAALERALEASSRLGADLGVLRRVRQLLIGLLRLVGPVEHLVEQRRALQGGALAFRRGRAGARLLVQERHQSGGIDARAQCALQPGARLR
jgi:hypothetical protein